MVAVFEVVTRVGIWMTARHGQLRRWALSLLATAASTYLLDATAAAAGLWLVAMDLHQGLDPQWIVALLVVSYAVWAVGLRTGLQANGMLLATTGTTTNVLSKAAYDLTRRSSGSVRAQRLAAGIGYAGTEVAKEVPYYAGAFGAAAFSDSIAAEEALVFLAGANLGAGLYELVLARLTRAFLGRRAVRRARGYASFEADLGAGGEPQWLRPRR